MNKPKMYRQGDVLLIEAGQVDTSKATKVKPVRGKLILAEGEQTGHHHAVASGAADLFSIDGKIVLVVGEPTPLTHQEHGHIEIAPGTYWVTRQREYSPAEIRRVID